MTTPQVISGTIDSYTDPTHPNANYGQDAHLRCGVSREAYVTFSVPVPQGVPTLYSAILDLNITGDGFGSATTIEIAVVTASWKERTITHNNKPAVGAVQTYSISGAKGDVKTFDITALLTPIFGVTTFYGLRIRATAGGTAGNKQFGSSENATTKYRPLLRVTWGQQPEAPTNLIPDDALSVQTSQPKLSWNFGQQQLELNAFQVQVDTAADFAAPLTHDSGWVGSEETVYTLPIILVAGTTYYWRVRERSAFNVIGKWSGTASFVYTALSTLVVTAPSSQGDTDTPLVNWTFAGQFQARVAVLLDKTSIHNSPFLTGTSYEIPRGTNKEPIIDEKGRLYEIRVRAWDNVDRQATPGSPAFREVIVPYTLRAVGSAVAPVTALAYTIDPNGYTVNVTWTRALTCDKYGVWQNGKLLATIDAGNVLVGGTSYLWPLNILSPKRNIVITAGVVVSGRIDWSVDTAVMLNWCPIGVWVYDTDQNEAVQVMVDPGGLDMNRTSDREVHLPLGREDPVVFQTSQRGWEGEVNGLVMTAAERDRLMRIVRRNIFQGNPCQVMGPDLNLNSDLGDPIITAIQPAGYFQVSVPFVQVAGPWNW